MAGEVCVVRDGAGETFTPVARVPVAEGGEDTPSSVRVPASDPDGVAEFAVPLGEGVRPSWSPGLAGVQPATLVSSDNARTSVRIVAIGPSSPVARPPRKSAGPARRP
jgi:hypothetical protein